MNVGNLSLFHFLQKNIFFSILLKMKTAKLKYIENHLIIYAVC